ncbi:CNNM domain-containing protein, partial [Acinetobacter baumannii]
VTALAIAAFGNHQRVITAATAFVAALLIIFAEIVPKVIGATHPERIALFTSFILKPLMRIAKPLVWFVNIFVSAILKVLRIKTGSRA